VVSKRKKGIQACSQRYGFMNSTQASEASDGKPVYRCPICKDWHIGR